MTKKSHRKAGTHERAIAEIFTATYYPDGDGEFRRVPLSGGWDKRIAPGDIIPFRKMASAYGAKNDMSTVPNFIIDNTFPFSVECKNWADENVKHFFSGLYSDESQIFGWMEQAESDALYVKKIPLVVFKLYRTENLVILRANDFYQIANLFGNFVGKFYMLERIEKEGTIRLVFASLKDFIEWIDWYVYKLQDNIRHIRTLIPKED